ncbi:MAG TPA: hypothetical protein VIX91_01420 [Candidatus Acidoferrum sp.]
MNCKAFSCTLRILAVLVFAVATGAQAQAPSPTRFSGILNDYTAATGVGGPWEMHGSWSLKLKGDSRTADFSAVMTMEHPDYWVLANPTPPTVPPAPTLSPTVDNPGMRNPHTHHLSMTDATVSYDMATLSLCPVDSPPTTVRFVLTGPADITGNGTAAPFQTTPAGVTTLSALQVCITGGTEVTYSNMTMTFQTGAPAIKHFGSLPIHGVVRKSHAHDSERDDSHR